MTADQQFVPYLRVPIPTPGGEPLDAMHQALLEPFHPGGTLRPDFDVIMTLAEPGDRGRCLPIPWWLVVGAEAPDAFHADLWRCFFHDFVATPVPPPPPWLAAHTGGPAHEPVMAELV